MAYVTVTSTSNFIEVDFGVYAGYSTGTGIIPKKRKFSKEQLVITLIENDEYVEGCTIYNGLVFPSTFDGATRTFKVDSIDGEAPLSNSDLYNKLSAILI